MVLSLRLIIQRICASRFCRVLHLVSTFALWPCCSSSAPVFLDSCSMGHLCVVRWMVVSVLRTLSPAQSCCSRLLVNQIYGRCGIPRTSQGPGVPWEIWSPLDQGHKAVPESKEVLRTWAARESPGPLIQGSTFYKFEAHPLRCVVRICAIWCGSIDCKSLQQNKQVRANMTSTKNKHTRT